MYYYIKRRSKEKSVRYVKGIGSRLRENIMFSFDDVLLDKVKEEQRLDSEQTSSDLLKESKEFLVEKIIRLQDKLKGNKELSKSISNAIADGFNKAIKGDTSTITTSSNANIRLATMDDFKIVHTYAENSIQGLKQEFDEYRDGLERVYELNEYLAEFRRLNIYEKYISSVIPEKPYNYNCVISEETDKKVRDAIIDAKQRQYDYDTGWNDCLRTCRCKKVKNVKERNMYEKV